jgi:hypothetical protein
VAILGKCCFKESGLQSLTIELGSRLQKLEEDVLAGCLLLGYLSLPSSVEFVADAAHFREVNTFERTVVVFIRAGINCDEWGKVFLRCDPSIEFQEGYDQCLVDLTHHC